MRTDIFNADLLAYAQVFKVMTAPLGDHAPRLRLLSVDYKDKRGIDCSQDIAVGQNPDMSDERLVELVRNQCAGMGLTVSAISEVTETASGIVPRALYIRPGFLEESIADQGLPVPDDIAAAMEAVGVHPVNWDELTQKGCGTNGR